uniref:Tc1-like transposase DDE domain-containing protein n=1 Tax=Oncorhynchus tshawytscha TaxID=74940 RepID=A0AAZ3PD04_ONCTS
MLTFDGHWDAGEVMHPGLNCTGQMAVRYGVVWASGLLIINVVNRVPHGGGGVMVWAGISYGQRTQLHFIEGNLNADRYRDDILRPIVMPFIRRHHLMFLHDNARPHVTRICTQFLEAENVSVPWPAYSPDMSTIEHVLHTLDRRVRQRVPVPTNIQQLHTAIEEKWDNIPQATINRLINSM